jgi:hypothetical protein
LNPSRQTASAGCRRHGPRTTAPGAPDQSSPGSCRVLNHQR